MTTNSASFALHPANDKTGEKGLGLGVGVYGLGA